MKVHDGKGGIDFISCAGLFAGMMTDPTANSGKRMIRFKQLKSFMVLAFFNQGDKSLGAYMGRAGNPAGSRSFFADGIGSGYGLGILLVGGFSQGKPLVVFIRDLDRAHLCAFAATGAFARINEPGPLPYLGGKISGVSLQINKFRIG
jgi:hypothetical protein